jgi:hypothetical protein
VEPFNSVLLFSYRLLSCVAQDFLPEVRTVISMPGPTRVSESSDTGVHRSLPGRSWSQPVAYAPPLALRLSMLSAPAPNATIWSSPPAIITFLRKWLPLL